jgi:hypothetical protein
LLTQAPQHAPGVLLVLGVRKGVGLSAQQLRTQLGQLGIIGVDQGQRIHRAFGLPAAGPCLPHDRGQHGAAARVLVTRELDAVGEIPRRRHLAQHQVNHGTLASGLIRDVGHHLGQVDGLQRFQSFPRILL